MCFLHRELDKFWAVKLALLGLNPSAVHLHKQQQSITYVHTRAHTRAHTYTYTPDDSSLEAKLRESQVGVVGAEAQAILRPVRVRVCMCVGVGV